MSWKAKRYRRRARRACLMCSEVATFRARNGRYKSDRHHELCERCWQSVSQARRAIRPRWTVRVRRPTGPLPLSALSS